MAKTSNVVRSATRKQIKWRTVAIAALFIVCLLVVLPTQANQGIKWINNKTNLGIPTLPDKGFSLGLDLQGGAHLVYRANVDTIPPADRASSVDGVRDVIERRVRGGLGVAEPLVETARVGEDYNVIVELPGITNVSDAIKMIGETPVLEFKEENTEPARELTAAEKQQMADFNAAADKKIKTAQKELAQGGDFLALVAKYSDDADAKIKNGNIGFITADTYPELYAWAKTHNIGDISKDIIKSSKGYSIPKKISERDGDKRVSVSHILICYKGAELCGSEISQADAKIKAEELKKIATVQNFNELAKQNSTEPGAKDTGGDLGFISKGQTVPEFEKAAFDAPINVIVGPVETKYGYHLILKKAEETPKEYELARIFAKTETATDILPPNDQWKFTGLTGKQLTKAEVVQSSQTAQIQVSLTFNSDGAKLFGDITKRNVGKMVAIFLDGEPISIPRVNEPILDGSAVITGDFKWDEAKLLAQRLNSGALPVPVELINQQKVDATLGADSLAASFKAGVIGLIFVILFMILYYRLPGAVSVLALLVYTVLVLAIFKLIGFTLTLSGIAGFILSVGMAVDANVLVFERLKEELWMGKSLKSATEEAFLRAWTSIRDSNITTMISCVFLIWMGTGFVKGFAVILFLGVIASMFTAITITRTLMRFFFYWFGDNANWMFLGYRKPEPSAAPDVQSNTKPQ